MLKWTKHQQQLLLLQEQQQQPNQPPKYHTLAQLSHNKALHEHFLGGRNNRRRDDNCRKRYSTGNCREIPHRPSMQQLTTMPTVAQKLERRHRANRHSLDNQLDERIGGASGAAGQRSAARLRHSLGGANENKENFGVDFMRSPFSQTSPFNALKDLSNGKSPRRTPGRRSTLGTTATPLHPKSGNTPVRMAAGRFSDDFAEDDEATPLSRLRFRPIRRDIEAESLSSSRMGDVTLDRMLDAIIESARKEVTKIGIVANSDGEQLHATVVAKNSTHENMSLDAGDTTLYAGDDCETSIHEMEVRTPTHLKRQRVVRRKNTTRATDLKGADMKRRQVDFVEQEITPVPLPQVTPMSNGGMIGLTLPHGIPSPDTPLFKRTTVNDSAQLLAMATPPPPALNATMTVNAEYSSARDMQRCSTPTLEEAHSIKRCLSFSSDDDADYSAAKRSSVASSNTSSTGEPFGSCTSRSASQMSQNSLKPLAAKGSVDVAIFVERNQLNVHVIRCRDLQRSNGSTALNAYVKVALIRQPPGNENTPKDKGENSFQRTAVHRHSSRPYFDHRFKFDLSGEQATIADERLQLAVWHRDRQLKRSEFLGCMSFSLPSLLQHPVNGSYKLQTQTCLNNPQPAVALQILVAPNHTTTHHTTTTTTSGAATTTIPNTQVPIQQQQHQLTHQPTMTSTLTRQKSNEDDVVSIDSMAQASAGTAAGEPMVLSKKALHQRDADENLFLRFLELDPPADAATTTASTGTTTTTTTVTTTAGSSSNAASAAANANSGRRLSNSSKNIGRTPFTMTKKLTRSAERGFGFSIVWTHPPRVEKIEPSLSADRAGILPGDYVIFVDKHNVVTMPEADVLNLIRSQGPSLTLEIFRRSGVSGSSVGGTGGGGGGGGGAGSSITGGSGSILLPGVGATVPAFSFTGRPPVAPNAPPALAMNGKAPASRVTSAASIYASDDATTTTTTTATAAATGSLRRMAPQPPQSAASTAVASNGGCGGGCVLVNSAPRPSTACSGTSSIEAAKRRLNLPQVTFSKESIVPIMDNRRRFLLQLISREQNFISALHFGMQRFVQPLQERKDLISPNDHRTLFQNMDELLRIAEDILEQLCNDEQEPQMNFASRVYLSKTTAICAAYKKYCNGIKRADCVLVNKSRQTGSEFVAFITEPPVPRKRPDLTMFIHRPLQHFREVLKLMQLLSSNCHVDTEEHKNFGSVINELQAAYREITMSSGLMEPLGEGRPLLTLQDLESRMVFTKCKPFTLAVQGRQWIFGGDLSRVEGRSVKPYWTLLFSDIIVFAKVSRDRVLFITEEPISIANIVDSCFHMRKKTAEFRLTVDPNGRLAESPTGYCAPDLTRTPKKNSRRKGLILRAPSLELKAVWQNLLQRQIFLVNAALGSTPLSSPLDSPDVLNTLVPLSDIGIASASIGSIKLPSMDSINLKNQPANANNSNSNHHNHHLAQHQQQHGHHHQQHQQNQQQQQLPQQTNRLSNTSEQLEMLIDEKCRILNKTGTPKSSALHLANWMKGQLDKQQEQARLAAARSPDAVSRDEEHLLYPDSDQDERITYWTRQQLEKRTKELNLAKETGLLSAKPNFGGKRLSGVEELSMSDAYSENVSQLSQSHSTTSDSQITVRSSPHVLDKLAVCRHCHKNCQQSAGAGLAAPHQQVVSPGAITAGGATASPTRGRGDGGSGGSGSGNGALFCNSLKVQHSQSSPNRCCKLTNGIGIASSRTGSTSSISSSTITGEQPSDHSSKIVASSSRRETGDTESDVAQLITDDVSQQSEATDDSVNAIPSSSSGGGFGFTASTGYGTDGGGGGTGPAGGGAGGGGAGTGGGGDPTKRRFTDGLGKLRILDDKHEARLLDGPHFAENMNGHCSSGGESTDSPGRKTDTLGRERKKPTPPPRKLGTVIPPTAKDLKMPATEKAKASVTISEKTTIHVAQKTQEDIHQATTKTNTTPTKSPKSPRKPQTPTATRAAQFTPCHCKCRPKDFENTTLSPDEVQQETCKIIESPKQSPKMPRQQNGVATTSTGGSAPADRHKDCKCVCGAGTMKKPKETNEFADDDLSLMLIGLAQLAPAARLVKLAATPSAPLSTPTSSQPPLADASDGGFVPTIAVVPPTPDSVLTKTATNVWDNSASSGATKLDYSNLPRQPVIENIPEDSCDESPLDEEPPYRPMSNALRRYGTMSSLEKMPSDDRLDDGELDDLDDDDDDDLPGGGGGGGGGGYDDEDDDKARADHLEARRRDDEVREENDCSYDSNVATNGEDDDDYSAASGSAWTSRAGTLVGKMSFFEESRAFIDKYLGRWNQENTAVGSATPGTQGNSEPEEQMEECTSGATSGEEAWGTPTSGGENDDIHLNSENTHSSPTKSSTSLNDDDDTELMMDELLMAPPMTASTIRGLLPRRRLEPLFEEETESDEEKTQQESEELKKGETTTNGHYLKDLAGTSSDEDVGKSEEEEEGYDEEDEEEEDPTSTEEPRLQADLQTTTLGPRPLRDPGIILPTAVLKASSCEYLLEQRQQRQATSVATTTILTSNTAGKGSSHNLAGAAHLMPTLNMQMETETTTMMSTTTLTMTKLPKTMTTTTTTPTTTMTTTTTTSRALASPAHSLISTTTNSVNAITSKSSSSVSNVSVRPAKFVPPPPPPRRLLLTQTDLKTASGKNTYKAPPVPTSSGVSADVGSSADAATNTTTISADNAAVDAHVLSPTTMTKTPPTPTTAVTTTTTTTAINNKEVVRPAPRVASNTKGSAGSTGITVKRPSSTIIETSLLGSVVPVVRPSSPPSTSSQTASRMTITTTTTTPATVKTPEKSDVNQVELEQKSVCGGASKSDSVPVHVGSGLSPRLEMRLALNHDILGDEDLICYDPGPDLTTILGHDLSRFQRLTGRDLLNRSAMNRVQPREAVISFSQQRNSKMDTPTVNRRPRPNVNATQLAIGTVQQQQQQTGSPAHLGLGGSARVGGVPQHLQPNRNTWSNSVFADPSSDASGRGVASSKSYSCNSDESNLSDLEILAKREKIYCMSQLKSGSPVRMMTMTSGSTRTMIMRSRDSLSSNPQLMRTTSITSMGGETETLAVGQPSRVRKIGRDETALIEAGKGSRLINFIKRRNSEIPLSSANCSQTSLCESAMSATPVHQKQVPLSPRKDNDKPSLNRRLWKHLTKRRRANSVSEIAAS